MDFKPLYKPERDLYAIGCNLAQGRLDGACYDLLASESSLTSFLTVARGDAPAQALVPARQAVHPRRRADRA